MTAQLPAGTKDQPIFMKIIRDEDGIKWGNLLVMLAATVLTGYVGTRAQRAGGRIDFERELKMKAALFGERVGAAVTNAGCRLSIASSRAYDRARG